ncbi:alpha/beta fold hydrolase [Parasphingopyxis lamellibrachiae]|uniref:Pimeloyl-ACP methyl ester carboxylesterase n=1 Tax=Parasphingopyxis lamellibrachiae TaxID=680125 RepID=A0A3D9FFD8_9SPHN|nr:alpha/beta hydrolase [Parasphingopyxis lamellibrachiae]RED15816.1 pimeloyl-ACP methyl ester carboxylesterase [Parasphingopyxis lamellibrachiae]
MADYSDGVWWSNDGLRLHYRSYAGPSDKPPILCLHGLTRNARDWEPVAERLTGDWQIYVLEMRGRGESAYAPDPMTYVPLTYVQDVEAFLKDRNIDRYVAFGTSLGGIITMLQAATRPERLAAVMLNDVGPVIEEDGVERIRGYVGKGGNFPTWLHAARGLQTGFGDIYPKWELADWLAMAKRLCKLLPSGRIGYDYDMRIAEPFRVPGGESGFDMWAAFAGLKEIPTILVRGGHSEILSETTALEMKRRKPDLEIATVPDVGHAPVLDEPEAEAAIDSLLERVRA